MNAFLGKLYLRALAIRDREEGQAMAEYGIIVALIAVVCIVAIAAIGTRLNIGFGKIVNSLPNA